MTSGDQLSNRALVGEGLALVVDAAEPFVSRVVGDAIGDGRQWTTVLSEKDERAGYSSVRFESGDLVPILRVMTERLGAHGFLFTDAMAPIVATYANELRATRNRWAHFQHFDDADAFRALDTAERLARGVGAEAVAARISALKTVPLARLAVTENSAAQSTPSTVADGDGEPEVRPQVPVDAKATRIERQDEASEADDVAAALRELLAALTRPMPLAVLSQRIVARFGPEAIQSWGGSGGFIAFVQRCEPAAAVSGPQPGYVHPTGRPIPEGWDREPQDSDVPAAIRELRTADQNLPLITWARMKDTIAALLTTGELDGEALAGLTRSGIDGRSKEAVVNAGEQGRLVYRSHVAWVLGALQTEHDRDGLVTISSATKAVAARIATLAAPAGVAPDRLHSAVRDWLSASDAPEASAPDHLHVGRSSVAGSPAVSLSTTATAAGQYRA